MMFLSTFQVSIISEKLLDRIVFRQKAWYRTLDNEGVGLCVVHVIPWSGNWIPEKDFFQIVVVPIQSYQENKIHPFNQSLLLKTVLSHRWLIPSSCLYWPPATWKRPPTLAPWKPLLAEGSSPTSLHTMSPGVGDGRETDGIRGT